MPKKMAVSYLPIFQNDISLSLLSDLAQRVIFETNVGKSEFSQR